MVSREDPPLIEHDISGRDMEASSQTDNVLPYVFFGSLCVCAPRLHIEPLINDIVRGRVAPPHPAE